MDSADYHLYSINEDLYDSLSARGEELLEAHKKAFMGDNYAIPPVPTLEELQHQCDKWASQKAHLEKLCAPQELVSVAEENLIKLYLDIHNKNYGSMDDNVYVDYRESYFAKEEEWEDSDAKELLMTEIYTHNENEYDKLKSAIVN